jgi:hypothetical protein
LVPVTPPQMQILEMFPPGNIGIIVEMMLLPAAAFITIENFREIFWLPDDGAIALMHEHIVATLPEIFEGSCGSMAASRAV